MYKDREPISLTHDIMVENKKKKVIKLMESKGFKLVEDNKIFPKIDTLSYVIDISGNTATTIKFALCIKDSKELLKSTNECQISSKEAVERMRVLNKDFVNMPECRIITKQEAKEIYEKFETIPVGLTKEDFLENKKNCKEIKRIWFALSKDGEE